MRRPIQSHSFPGIRASLATGVAVMLLIHGSITQAQVRRQATGFPAAETAAVKTLPGCEQHGTAVSWAPDLATAREWAREQSKLLFVMHLSGDFTDPVFT